MANWKKLASGAAGAGGEEPLEVVPLEQTFTQFVRNGTNATRTFTTGIDIANNTGAMQTKQFAKGPSWATAEYNDLRSTTTWVYSSSIYPTIPVFNFTGSYGTKFYSATYMNGFTSTGHGYTSAWQMNSTYYRMLDVVWRTSGRFFSEQTYVGDATNGRKLFHGLGCTVGSVMIKNDKEGWNAMWWHKDIGGTNKWYRFQTNPNVTAPVTISNGDITVDDNYVTIGSSGYFNSNNLDYIMWVFAHDPDGPDGDGTGKIACGSYTGSTSEVDVDLGWHPQLLYIKNRNRTSDWKILADSMRFHDDTNCQTTSFNFNNSTTGERHQYVMPNGKGFKVAGSGSNIDDFNYGTDSFDYIAVRAGNTGTPTSSSDFFAVDTEAYVDHHSQTATAGFAPDMFVTKSTGGSNVRNYCRLFGRKRLHLDTTAGHLDGSPTIGWDAHDGLWNTLVTNYITYMWKRQRGAFDIVTWDGTGSATTVPHNLGVVPEMIWYKRIDDSSTWRVYNSAIGITNYLALNQSWGKNTDTNALAFNATSPTSSVFSVGTHNDTNGSGMKYLAYLFASVDGVCKLGTFAGSNSQVNVDCGFTNGIKFLMIKNSGATGDWYVWDTEQGINSGPHPSNEPISTWNNSNGQLTGYNAINSMSYGFSVLSGVGSGINSAGNNYIYYAIAA